MLGFYGAAAQGYTLRDDWLPAGSDFGGIDRQLPAPTDRIGKQPSFWVGFGELLFNSSALFGERARRAGITCNACHLNGHVNSRTFISGLSDRPGKIDVTAGLFNPAADDGVFNPVRIPSLRGVAATAPYGHKGAFADLASFTRHVIVDEFGGEPPAAEWIAALVAYQRSIRFLANPLLAADGRLSKQAPAAARRGEALFLARGRGETGRSCADCHPPARAFTDRRRHDVGTGTAVDTPSLRGLGQRDIYFHDGRYADLGAVVDHFDRRFSLGYGDRERHDLIAYLGAIGEGGRATVAARPEQGLVRLERFAAVLDGIIARGRRGWSEIAIEAMLAQLGRIDERLSGAGATQARTILGDLARGLRVIENKAAAGQAKQARAVLAAWRQDLARHRAAIVDAGRRSP